MIKFIEKIKNKVDKVKQLMKECENCKSKNKISHFDSVNKKEVMLCVDCKKTSDFD